MSRRELASHLGTSARTLRFCLGSRAGMGLLRTDRLASTETKRKKALDACRAAVDGNPKDAAARAALERVEGELAQRRESDDARSFETASIEAAELLARLDAFAKNGGSFNDPMGVARLVASLRTSLAGSDPAALRRAGTSLEEALQSEASFLDFTKQYAEGQQRAALEALAEARAEGRRIKAFIEDHVARNVSSQDVPRLLEIVAAIDNGVASGSATTIAAANASAVADLSTLKLDAALEAFSLAPKNVADAPAPTPNELYIDDGIRDDVAAARRKGFGVITFSHDNRTLCMVPGPLSEPLMEGLTPELHPLSGQLPGWTTRGVKNPDEGFSEARAGSCGALLLEASALAQVLAAAEREKTDYSILPLWFDERDISETQARIERDKASRAEAEQARLRRIEDEATQDRMRREKLGEEKARLEAELRDRYESAARGLAADTGDQVGAFIEAPDAPETAAVASLFPSLARWYRGQVSAGWELQSDGYASDLVDYGTVRWQGRALDTVFVKIAVGMKHRELGKYEETCLLVGVVVDQEFSRYRDVFESRCLEAEPGLGAWKSSQGFESRWVVD